jgi:hypothetical protein
VAAFVLREVWRAVYASLNIPMIKEPRHGKSAPLRRCLAAHEEPNLRLSEPEALENAQPTSYRHYRKLYSNLGRPVLRASISAFNETNDDEEASLIAYRIRNSIT